jgi:hypothetical protein
VEMGKSGSVVVALESEGMPKLEVMMPVSVMVEKVNDPVALVREMLPVKASWMKFTALLTYEVPASLYE